jgi:tetratricopeptide (TPR) repeat protein
MFWNAFPSLLPMAFPLKMLGWLLRFVLLSTTAVIGLQFFSSPESVYGAYSELFWGAWFGLAAFLLLGDFVRHTWERLRFAGRVSQAFGETGPDRGALIAAAHAIRADQEPLALKNLQRLPPLAPDETARAEARRLLAALAGAHWLFRQTPFDTLPHDVAAYPQLHALMFCQPAGRIALRTRSLNSEIERVTGPELDAIARGYMTLVSALTSAAENPASPFHSDAADLLTMLTGRSHLLHANERIAAWWQDMRPQLQRGGGALLAGLRLLQRGAFQEAANLLERLARDGLLSRETETLRRAARFLALFSQPQFQMNNADIPRYFAEGLYHQWHEIGVFRFPTAEVPEVVACCKRGKIYRDAKRSLIEDALDAWDRLGEDAAEPLAMLLRRLLDERGRHPPTRPDLWRAKWNARKHTFERDVALLMDGIVATSRQRWAAALQAFDAAAALDTASSLPLVNKVSVLLKSGRKQEARRLIEHIQIIHPKDGQALIAMGRMLAIHLEDTVESEKLFEKALDLVQPQTEVLNYLGEVKMLAGNYEDSEFYFQQARELDPAQPGPKLGLARALMELRRFTDAISVLKEVVRDGPSDARDLANFMLYRTHREAGEDRVSLKYLDLVPTRFFNDPDTIDDIAVHLESEKMYAKAREFAERAMLLRTTGRGRNDDSDALGV